MITEAGLLKKNVTSTMHDGKLYFDVEEIREAYPHTIFPPEKIKELTIGLFLRETILVEDIQEMTEFDIKILQTLKFNPLKK